MKISQLIKVSISLLCAALAQPVIADEQGLEIGVALGYGQYGAVTYGNSDTPLAVLPRLSYYQDRFYVEDLNLGYNIWQHQHWAIDLTTKQSFDALLLRQHSLTDSFLRGLLISEVPLPLPMGAELPNYLHPTKRQLSYLAGATLFYQQDNLQFSSGYHQDVSGVHHGFEWQTKATYIVNVANFAVATGAEIRYLSSNYSNYHFGVGPKDTTANIYEYSPDSAWLPTLKIEASYQLAEDVRLIGNWRREWLPSKYQPSMYFESRQHDIWFSGVLWTW